NLLRVLGNLDADALQRLDFLLCRALSALNNGPRVAHALARRRRPPGNEGDDRLGDILGDVASRGLLICAADLADQHDLFGERVVLEKLQHVDEVRPFDRVAADPDGGGLADTGPGQRIDDLVRQRAGARNHTDRAGYGDVTRHNAN